MVKNLYLLRHAKSEHPDGVGDHDRPLNGRGKGNAVEMGKYIAETGVPDVILCSDSTRTKQTLQGVLQAFAHEPKVFYLKQLYLATPGEILREVSKLGDDVTSVMVVAHNPGIHQLSVLLTGDITDAALFNTMRAKFPTCALAMLATGVASWKELEPGFCSLEKFITPKELIS